MLLARIQLIRYVESLLMGFRKRANDLKSRYNKDVRVANDKIRHLKYETLRKQLCEIPYWPHRYCHKIIGLNGDNFRKSLEDFEGQFPQLKSLGQNESRNGKYLSITYEIQAQHVDEIISLWVASEELSDCIKVM